MGLRNLDFVFSFSFAGKGDLYVKSVPSFFRVIVNIASSVGMEL